MERSLQAHGLKPPAESLVYSQCGALGCGGAGVGDKGVQLFWIFAAWEGFDASDDVNAPGLERSDSLGDVQRVEAAGGDKLEPALTAEELCACSLPVIGDAGAAWRRLPCASR